MRPAPLLLIPGLLNDARVWQFQLPALTEVTSVSVANIREHDTIEALAADAIAQAPSEKFALAGFSMGGYVALEIMRQVPERVASLALIDTNARADTQETIDVRVESIALAETDFDEVIENLLPKMIHASNLNDPYLVNTFFDMCRTVGVETFQRQQTAIMNRIDSRPFLCDIQCPTLILCGDEDVVTPPSVHEEMADLISGSKLVVVEASAHISMFDQPSKVTESMLEWLTKS